MTTDTLTRVPISAVAFLAILLTNSGCAGQRLDAKAEALLSGDYRLTLRATEGPRAGHSTRGVLHLGASSAGGAESSVWGWMDVNFRDVAAPVFEEDGLSAHSRDPEKPGVIVWRAREDDGRVRLVLLVGSSANSREMIEDGAGIELRVQAIDANGFRGRWLEAGIVSSGRGTFKAERVPP